jgi:hypothetical protein
MILCWYHRRRALDTYLVEMLPASGSNYHVNTTTTAPYVKQGMSELLKGNDCPDNRVQINLLMLI